VSEEMFYDFITTTACLLAGLVSGRLYGHMHQSFLNRLLNSSSEEVFRKTYLFVAVRIAATSLIKFSAFLFGALQGLVCLSGFLISRWLWIFSTLKKRKETLRM